MRENEGLTLLGNKNVKYGTEYDPGLLETFENKHPENDYWVKFNCPEFTSLCPITGQPDFANIIISYVPAVRMVESKSLKLYRGGISIDPYCNYGKPGTKWEKIAENRLAWHDMNPEAVDNR